MALLGRHDGRNFGYGRVKTQSDRWLAFVKWCRSEAAPRVNDARQIDRKVLSDYAAY